MQGNILNSYRPLSSWLVEPRSHKPLVPGATPGGGTINTIVFYLERTKWKLQQN